MTGYLRRVIRSLSFYPLTTFWLVSCTALGAVASDRIDLGVGLVLVTSSAVLLMLFATNREIRTVHRLVNYQRTELADSTIELFVRDEEHRP